MQATSELTGLRSRLATVQQQRSQLEADNAAAKAELDELRQQPHNVTLARQHLEQQVRRGRHWGYIRHSDRGVTSYSYDDMLDADFAS